MFQYALSSAEVASAPAGKLVYTQLLNARGGIESDLTIVPLSLPAAR